MLFFLFVFSLQNQYPIGTINTAAGANVRDGPGTQYSRVTAIANGQHVNVLGSNGTWWKIEYNGIEGYVLAELMIVPAVVHAEGGLRIRTGPGTTYDSVGSAPNGASISVTSIADDEWYGVKYNSYTGFSSRQYITLYVESGGETGRVIQDEIDQFGIQNAKADDINIVLDQFNIKTNSQIRWFLTFAKYFTRGGSVIEEKDSGIRYEFDNDLGNTHPGDGKLFKGAGYYMMRGRILYKDFSEFMNDPQILTLGSSYVTSNYPWISAGFLFKHFELNTLCLKKSVIVEEMLLKIAKNYNGLREIKAIYENALSIWPDPV